MIQQARQRARKENNGVNTLVPGWKELWIRVPDFHGSAIILVRQTFVKEWGWWLGWEVGMEV